MAHNALAGGPHPTGDDAPLPARVRWTRWIYLCLAWLFVGCVVGQVFFAGMAIFADSRYWRWYTTFIHTFEYLPLLMLAFAFAARLPVAMRWLTFALTALIVAQYATVNIGGHDRHVGRALNRLDNVRHSSPSSPSSRASSAAASAPRASPSSTTSASASASGSDSARSPSPSPAP